MTMPGTGQRTTTRAMTRTLALMMTMALLAACGSLIAAMTPMARGARLSAGPQPGVTRTDLQRHDLSAAGREVLQTRVELAPGVTSPRHTHPGEEIIYLLEGALEYEVAGRPPVTLRPGDVLFVPANTPHLARNVGSGPGAELATYIVEKGKPLSVVVK